MQNTNPRPYKGSEWRKWDLQIHCPDDVLNNQFDGKTSDEKWDKYIKQLEKTDLEAIAVTNYFCIDGYEKILNFKHRGRLKNINVILPNIEFRLSQPNRNGEYINIHVIFSDNLDASKINDFLARLKIISTDEDRKDLFCTPKDLKEIGYDKALIELSSLLEELEKNFVPQRDYLIAGVARGYGAFRPAPHEGRGSALAIEIDKMSDFFFGRSDDIPHFLNTSRFSKAKEKAVVRTSDAHDLNKIGTGFTWIKADCTFDGLKQIIYEPSDRVCLNENRPLYFHPQIVSAKLLKTNDYQPKKNDFPPITISQEIFFSPNLTAIIGPRAAGKTVLVELIGYVANDFSTNKKDNNFPLIEFLNKGFPNLEMKISFQSGAEEVTTLKRLVKDWKDPYYAPPLKIEYWTQGEIEKKANSPKQIANYIADRLRSDLLAKTKAEVEILQKEMESLRNNYSRKLEVEIEKKKLEAERKQIEIYFEKLKTKEYKKITAEIKDNRAKTQMIEALTQDIENQKDLVKNLSTQVKLSNTVAKERILPLFKTENQLKEKIKEFYELKDKKLASIIDSLEHMIIEINESAVKKNLIKKNTELLKKFTDYCKLNGINVTRAEVEKRNNRIKFIDQQLSRLEKNLEKFKEDKKRHGQLVIGLKKKLKLWKKENKKIIEEFNESLEDSNIMALWNDPDNDISEWIKDQFLQSNSELKKNIEENFKRKSPVREDYLEDIIKELVSKYKDNTIEEILSLLNEGKAPILKDASGKIETIKWFFEDSNTKIIQEDLIMRMAAYAETGENYIKYKKKVLGKDSMSFGEKCGTLVELILLSGDHPLIIDQPEDHLDAKFIAEKVVALVKKQKIKRQIIICTHNANIVVLGDSELVTALSVDSKNKVNVNQGSLENIEIRKTIFDILEGGETAFKKREQKYGEAVT